MADGTTSEELTVKAVEAARQAMAEYADGKLQRFAMEATLALEKGAKAALAKINPVLIADPRNVESQLYLAGVPVGGTKGARRIRTISCKEALERVKHLVPTLRVEDADQLISVRDGATHFLVSEREAVESLVIPFLACFQLLQERLELADDDVFGSYGDLVKSAREKHSKEVDRKVAAKIARAKHAFEERYGHIDEKARELVLTTIAGNIALAKYDELAAPCPACNSTGVLSGQHEFLGWEADDVDDEGHATGAYPNVVLFANAFKCRICGLQLNGSDELVAVGLESEVEVEDVDPWDFHDEDDGSDDWN